MQCTATADELIDLLGQFETNLKSKGWTSIYKALQAAWNRNKVDRLSQSLNSFRSEIALRILVSLNSKLNTHTTDVDGRLASHSKKDYEIVEVLSIDQSALRPSTEQLHSESERGHDSAIAAILTLRGGDTRILTQRQNVFKHNNDLLNKERQQTFVTFREEHTSLNNPDGVVNIERRNIKTVHTQVLDCLHFRQMGDRIGDVSPAHRKTFEWVFESAEDNEHPWDSLKRWFESGSGCYWVGGKAGAGKSTFMKYLLEEQQTSRALATWAGNNKLVVASFFFWNLGSKLQKSQIGLLRSLLYEILEACPELTAHILPDLYRAAVAGSDQVKDITLSELKRAFRSLSAQRDFPVRICLFIDGIDEYEEDHVEISEFFTSIPKDSLIKVLVSSRPIPACVMSFSYCPKLQLQDLTYEDIRIYTTDRIKHNLGFKQLLEEDQMQAHQLVDGIVTKACGVFLWVIVVVRRLLDGLQKFDRLRDLRSRLEGLPSDLEKLYNHMLKKMEPQYQKDASRIFQIVFRSITLANEIPLSTMHLAHIDEDDPDHALRLEIFELSPRQRLAKCIAIEGRIRSRCCGLVEVLQDRTIHPEERMVRSCVSFLHRTVAEFIRDERIWNNLIALTAGLKFDTNVALVGACLAEVKTNAEEETVNVSSNRIWQSMRSCLQYARLAEKSAQCSQTEYLDELDRVMRHHWSNVRQWHDGSARMSFPTETKGVRNHWSCSIGVLVDDFHGVAEILDADASICSLAARAGLTLYLRETWPRHCQFLTESQVQHALKTVIVSHANNFKEKVQSSSENTFSTFITDDGSVASETYVSMLRFLLEQTANLQYGQRVRSEIWLQALKHTDRLVKYSAGFWNTPAEDEIALWSNSLAILIEYGVDPNAEIDIGNRLGAHQRSALLVIMTLFTQLPTQVGTMRSIVAKRNDLRQTLESLGAHQKEWKDGRLVKGVQSAVPPIAVAGESLISAHSVGISGKRRSLRVRLREFLNPTYGIKTNR